MHLRQTMDLDPVGVATHLILSLSAEVAGVAVYGVDRERVRELANSEQMASVRVDVEPPGLCLRVPGAYARETAIGADPETGKRAAGTDGRVQVATVGRDVQVGGAGALTRLIRLRGQRLKLPQGACS